jgi:hypothetical protein
MRPTQSVKSDADTGFLYSTNKSSPGIFSVSPPARFGYGARRPPAAGPAETFQWIVKESFMSRFKSRFSFATAAALLVAMACLRAQGAGQVVPFGSVGDDTILLIHISGAHCSPEALKEAAKVVLGANAAKADDGIAKYKEMYDKAVAAGIEGATIAVREEKPAGDAPRKEPKPVVYFQLKEGADIEAVKKLVTSDMSAADRESAVFEKLPLGELVMYEKGSPPPANFDKDRALPFAEALATVGDAAVRIAFVPTAHLKEKMVKEEAPIKGMKEAASALANAKWTTVSVHLGNAPGMKSTVNTADAGSAKQLSDAINAVLDELKQQAANPKPDNPMAMFGPLVAPLIEGLRPATDGTKVTMGIKGEALANIANFAAQMGMLGGRNAPPGK